MIIGTSQFTSRARLAQRLAAAGDAGRASVGLLMALAWWFRGAIGRRFQLGAAASLLAARGHRNPACTWQHLDLFPTGPIGRPPRHGAGACAVRIPRPVARRANAARSPRAARRYADAGRPAHRADARQSPMPSRGSRSHSRCRCPKRSLSVEPTQVQMRRNEFAAPRRARSGIAAQPLHDANAAQPSEQVSAPEQRITVEQTPSSQARATAVARTESTQATQSRTAEMAAAVEVSRSTAQPVRREQQEPNEPAPSTPAAAIARATAAPAEVPRTAAEAPDHRSAHREHSAA